ncbi:MAG: hypothetical protein H6682_18410 [Candidatus Eisenbacteria bacterium]|nr:hypothetical protein [Candidatus Eisenbacteria bacterium]
MSDLDLRQTVERVVSALEALGVRFHITGGLASSYYGEPRTTRDADFVVRLGHSEGTKLVTALSREFLIEAEAVRQAIASRGLFQALDQDTLMKADFHVGERIEGELDRSVVHELFEGFSAPLVSKEDAILSKLIWVQEGSDRSRTDILGMLLDPTPFDLGWVRTQARVVGCGAILSELENQAGLEGDG